MKAEEYEKIILELIDRQLKREEEFMKTLNEIKALLEKRDNA